MMPAHALASMPALVPVMLVQGRALPEFDIAVADAPAAVMAPVIATSPLGEVEPASPSVASLEKPVTPKSFLQSITGPNDSAASVIDQMFPVDPKPTSVAAKDIAPATAAAFAPGTRAEFLLMQGRRSNFLHSGSANSSAQPKDADPQSTSSATQKCDDASADDHALADIQITNGKTAVAKDESVQKAEEAVSPSPPAPATVAVLPEQIAILHPVPPQTWKSHGGGQGIELGTRSPAMPGATEHNVVGQPRRAAVFQARAMNYADGLAEAIAPVSSESLHNSAAAQSSFAIPQMPTQALDSRGLSTVPQTVLQGPAAAQVVADRQLDLARDTLWLDQLATDIVSASTDTDHISFRLMPAHLGRLDVDLFTSSAGLTVNIVTSTEEAGRIVGSAQPGLVESLNAQGVRVADTQVTSGSDNSRQGQSQRHHPVRTQNDVAFGANDESTDQNKARPDGRFA